MPASRRPPFTGAPLAEPPLEALDPLPHPAAVARSRRERSTRRCENALIAGRRVYHARRGTCCDLPGALGRDDRVDQTVAEGDPPFARLISAAAFAEPVDA